MGKKKIDGQDLLLRKNPSFYQKKEIENRLDIEEISTKKSFPFFLIRQDASSQENWTINIYGYTRVGGVDWRLVKKNAFRLRHLAAVVSTALQPPFWHRRAISEFLTEISISGLLLAWLLVFFVSGCIFAFPNVTCSHETHSYSLLLLLMLWLCVLHPPRTTTMRRRRHNCLDVSQNFDIS